MYRDWRGPVYPPSSPSGAGSRATPTRFDTVELNATFYRLPTTTAVEHWAEQAPAGFVYAAKLGQFGSHRMKLRDAASWLPNHLDRIVPARTGARARRWCSSRRAGDATWRGSTSS